MHHRLPLDPVSRPRRPCIRAWLRVLFVASTLWVAIAAPPRTTRASEGGSYANRSERADEYRVKAAFLYNFVRYTTWPAGSFENQRSPIVVAVLGKSPFGKHLRNALADKKIGGRGIVLRGAREVEGALDAHVVFVGDASDAQRAELLRLSKGRPLVVIGELPGFAAEGAQFNFYLAGGKVRFEVNLEAVRGSKLEVSSQVLKLARIVRSKGAPR